MKTPVPDRYFKDTAQELMAELTCNGVKATLDAVPEERSRMVDFPPYTMLCFWSVRWLGRQEQKEAVKGFSWQGIK